MNDNTQETRISFSKDKVGEYKKGSSGITGTSDSSTEPKAKITGNIIGPGRVSVNSSSLFNENLEKLGISLGILPEKTEETENQFIEQISLESDTEDTVDLDEVPDWNTDMLDDLSEEEVIKNLNQHLGYRPATVDLALRFDENGNQLPQRVIEPEKNPYKKRENIVTENIFEPGQPSSSHPIAMPWKNSLIPAPPSAKDSFCRSCGSKYLTTDNFCGGCGNKRI
jgi:hypothetical protein